MSYGEVSFRTAGVPRKHGSLMGGRESELRRDAEKVGALRAGLTMYI